MEVKVKLNRRCTSTSCGNCNTCMIFCYNDTAFDGYGMQSCTYQWGSMNKIQVKHGTVQMGSRSKQNRRCTSKSCWHCNIYMMIICWKGIEFVGRCTQSGTPHWESMKKIQVKHDRVQVIWMLRSKQNRRSTSTSCWHCNACMIIWWKGIAFAGHCAQSGTHQWGSTKKIQVKHELGNRLYGSHGQKKIGVAHLRHAGTAMHASYFVEKV